MSVLFSPSCTMVLIIDE